MGWLMVICCEYETILRKNIRKMCTRAFHYQYCCCFAFNQALLVKISFYLIIYSLLMTMMMVPGVWWWFVFNFRKFNWFWQTTSLQIKIVYKYTRIHRCIFSSLHPKSNKFVFILHPKPLRLFWFKNTYTKTAKIQRKIEIKDILRWLMLFYLTFFPILSYPSAT